MQVTTKAQRTHSIALYSYAIWPLTIYSIIVLTPHHALFLPVCFTNVLLFPAIDHGCYLHNLLNTPACLVGVLFSSSVVGNVYTLGIVMLMILIQ